MKKVLISCVNYNSYNELSSYLQSIDDAAKCVVNYVCIDVLISDNSTYRKKIDLYNFKNINCSMFLSENIGFLGGALSIINQIEVSQYEYIIISNVDILMSENFFVTLLNYKKEENVAWIAPKVFSLKEKKDRNPKILNRLSKNKINTMLFLYSIPILYSLYELSIHKLRRNKLQKEYPKDFEIYAGHGSFMIFSSYFFQINRDLQYHSFLFGEEIFLAELIAKNNMKVVYNPDIFVNDIDHVSTGKLKDKLYCKLNYDSLTKIKKLNYE